MNERIKIWFHSGSNANIREISIYKPILVGLFFLFLGTGACLAYLGYDYYQLKTLSLYNGNLTRIIDVQAHEIKRHRTQIQTFAKTVEGLKKQVDSLSVLEDKVRLIADIKKPGNSSGLIGIGGIPGTRLDQDIPMDSMHNNLIREMHQQVKQSSAVIKEQTLNFNSLIQQLEKKRNLLASTPSIKPVEGWITSEFGYRKSPFTGERDFHSGLDIANKLGTGVTTTANGKVSYAGRKMYYGNLVIVDHGYGKVTKYGHLERILVKQGQKVNRGEVIALLGNTGQSTGPHVHYEVLINGTPVNPLKYILN